MPLLLRQAHVRVRSLIVLVALAWLQRIIQQNLVADQVFMRVHGVLIIVVLLGLLDFGSGTVFSLGLDLMPHSYALRLL